MKKVYVVKQQYGIRCRTYHSEMVVTNNEAALIRKHQKNKSMTHVEKGRYNELLDRIDEQFFETNFSEEQTTDWDEGIAEQVVSVAVVKRDDGDREKIVAQELSKSKKKLKKLGKKRQRREELLEKLEKAPSQQKAVISTATNLIGSRHQGLTVAH